MARRKANPLEGSTEQIIEYAVDSAKEIAINAAVETTRDTVSDALGLPLQRQGPKREAKSIFFTEDFWIISALGFQAISPSIESLIANGYKREYWFLLLNTLLLTIAGLLRKLNGDPDVFLTNKGKRAVQADIQKEELG